MTLRNRRYYPLVLMCSVLLMCSLSLFEARAATGSEPDAVHDGQHDFDFDFGVWKTQSSRLLHPLTGSTTWADMDGITVVKKVWDGRANLAEYKADGPAGHVALLSLRYYNAEAHQWGLAFATPKNGVLSVPCVGEFRSGRGDFVTRLSRLGFRGGNKSSIMRAICRNRLRESGSRCPRATNPTHTRYKSST